MSVEMQSYFLSGIKYLAVGLVGLFSNSCSMSYQPAKEIVVRDYGTYRYELQLDFKITGRGNIHTGSLSNYEDQETNWIYTKSLTGKIPASDLVLNGLRFKNESAYPLEGYIEFKGDSTIQVNISEFKSNKSKAGAWKSYRLNGQYRLVKGAPIDVNKP